MNMTHPTIRCCEDTGYPPYEQYRFQPVGKCLYCGNVITDEAHIKSFDGIFCDMDCCRNYYEIKEIKQNY